MDDLNITTTIPISTGSDGVTRIGATRVPLETVVEAFKNGSTAEEIVFQYPVLDLSDVYAVIGYFLKNRLKIEAYLHTSQSVSEQLRPIVQHRFQSDDIRQRLMTRRANLTSNNS